MKTHKQDHTKRRELIKKRAMAASGVMVKQQRGEEKKEAQKHIYYGLGGNVIHLRLSMSILFKPIFYD